MIERLSTHLMIRPEDVSPSAPDWEVIGTFNPGAIRVDDQVLLLVRVAERPREERSGFVALPRWEAGALIVDWVQADEWELVDPRVIRRRSDGLVRLTFTSHLRLARSRDGVTVDSLGPAVLLPETEYEEFGIEDPRITYLEGKYYITYVAVSRYGAATALASSADFETFTRHGLIYCPENKDVVLFSERINGAYFALHRPVSGTRFSNPQMWIARSPDLVHWGEHTFLYGGGQDWESGRVGAGAPPLAIPEGWLEIYHANRRSADPRTVGAYCGGAMLLARDDPSRILSVAAEPILQPELEFERAGFVNDVVFPMAVIDDDDRLLVYYGASDRYTAVTAVDRRTLIASLGRGPVNYRMPANPG